ncbi:hypothetical protein [Allomesorhizobium camelthorni]|uniref:Uncharacterized protein n=1 Tax=Allomesorhizobium camelthorni TaxID=475069 RepID=A0A6G4WAV6_9HYPH|nr:hypothetical protein [Mesorhizobium camelthorni]NGO51912.1 hypothetical protein [Mesorhizobium camelthorni]
MQIRWKRGLLRLWVIASVIWVVGLLVYFLADGMETQGVLGDTPGVEEGWTWFWWSLYYNWFLFPLGPILLYIFGLFAVAIVKTALWVWRGFRVTS